MGNDGEREIGPRAKPKENSTSQSSILRAVPGQVLKGVCRRDFLHRCGKWASGLAVTTLFGSLVVACADGRDNNEDEESYYPDRRERLIDQAGDFAGELSQTVSEEYDEEQAEGLAGEMVDIYGGMIDDLPYIGGDRNGLTDVLTECSMSVAFCLTMKKRGWSVDDAGRINYLTVERYYRENPVPPRQRYRSGDVAKKREDAEEFAAWTQERDYPGNWVAAFRGNVKRPYIYGTDYLECGNLKLCRDYGIVEFCKYLCMLDNITYRARGQGLTRTTTLADGFDRCDFRFSEDGAVSLEEPFTAERLREWGITT